MNTLNFPAGNMIATVMPVAGFKTNIVPADLIMAGKPVFSIRHMNTLSCRTGNLIVTKVPVAGFKTNIVPAGLL